MREECRPRVFENRVLRRIFGHEVIEKWRRLPNKEIYALYFSPNIMRVIKSRGLKWTGYVARIGERKGAHRGNLREGDHLEDPGVDERIILKWMFERLDGEHGLDRSCSG